MKLVVDASVAVKWVVAEEGRTDALRYTAGEQLTAPAFVLVEAANILWKKRRLKQLDAEQAQMGYDFIAGAFEKLVPSAILTSRALAMAMELDHPVYDCLYLACAEQEDAALLTADTGLALKAKGHQRIILLGDSS